MTVLDEEGREAPAGETGLVAAKRQPFMLGQGYWDQPEKWEECFVDGTWFIPGDLASRDERGTTSTRVDRTT